MAELNENENDKKSGAINGRIGGVLRQRLDEITRRYGTNDATMLDDALSALADYVEAAGKYRRPMKMVFDEESDAWQKQQLAEGKALYRAYKRSRKGGEPPNKT